ncbi:MAG: hypothetical protein QOD12_437 [Verrucomicrobiota bacterium]|jgi:hypothetical protein
MKTKSILLAIILAIQSAAAQDRPPKSDASRPVAGGGTPVPFTSSTIVAVTPRKEVVLKFTDGKTRSFRFAAQPVCFDKNGVLIEETLLTKGSRVLAHFMTENGQVLVDRLLVQP